MKLQKILKAREPGPLTVGNSATIWSKFISEDKVWLDKVKINLTFVYLFELLHIQVKKKS